MEATDRMSGLAMVYDEHVRKPMQMVLDEVKLEGLTKLVPEGYSSGLYFTTPDPDKMSQEEWSAKVEQMNEDWNRTHRGPYPTDLIFSCIWMPQKLVTAGDVSPRIVQAYTPIRFMLPTGEKETYRELKTRIEKESTRAVEHVRKDHNKGQVNAFYVGNLQVDYELSSSARECMPIAGSSFLHKPARDNFIPRWGFDLCLFDIEGGSS